MDNYFDLCNKLKDKKIYYIPGNHEEMLDDEDKYAFMNKVSEYNVEIIYNDSIKLSKNIILYGLNSEIETYKKFKKHGIDSKYIVDKLGKFDKNKYNILIAHNPLEFDAYAGTNASLVLSGHVHGGLIELPLLGGLFSPDYTLFPKYHMGMYEKNNTKMIVSRGIGLSKRIPIRINNNPEVTIINLIKE
jgi:predicted MPP superfamily phosphohydrolase